MAVARRLVLRLAYLGGGFAGWQRQPGARTVQGDLEDALERLYRVPVTLRGAGRTDAGVHAAGQVAHLDPPFAIAPPGVRSALNGLLRDDVRVLAVRAAPPGFDARRSACAKRYRYRLAWGEPLEPWEALRCWQLPGRPDVARMRRAVAAIAGTRDLRRSRRAATQAPGRAAPDERSSPRACSCAAAGQRSCSPVTASCAAWCGASSVRSSRSGAGRSRRRGSPRCCATRALHLRRRPRRRTA
jgi:tRNA pseudouridine38-40 synthase